MSSYAIHLSLRSGRAGPEAEADRVSPIIAAPMTASDHASTGRGLASGYDAVAGATRAAIRATLLI